MGTKWNISIWDALEDAFFIELEKEVVKMSHAFDQTYSRFIRTSLVWKIAEKAGTYEVPEDFLNMLRLYFDLYESSGKKLNPIIGFTISDLGYDDTYSLKQKEIVRPTPDLLKTVQIDGAKVTIAEPVLFDFGALGKGYFVDKISKYLKGKGIKRFLVNGSGDIYYSGIESISVGLEHPGDKSLVIGSIDMTAGAMCASGISRRRWGEHHHVIDPLKSLSAGEDIVATWVIAKNAALADALATCLFFVPPDALFAYTFEYVIMNKENKVKKSAGWKGKFF